MCSKYTTLFHSAKYVSHLSSWAPFGTNSIHKMQQAVLHKLSLQTNPYFGAECITKEKMIQTFPIAIFVQKQALWSKGYALLIF